MMDIYHIKYIIRRIKEQIYKEIVNTFQNIIQVNFEIEWVKSHQYSKKIES